MRFLFFLLLLFVFAFSTFSCLPPVYIYERPSIMEEEASGEYPVVNDELLKKRKIWGPLCLPRMSSRRTERFLPEQIKEEKKIIAL